MSSSRTDVIEYAVLRDFVIVRSGRCAAQRGIDGVTGRICYKDANECQSRDDSIMPAISRKASEAGKERKLSVAAAIATEKKHLSSQRFQANEGADQKQRHQSKAKTLVRTRPKRRRG